MKKIFFVLIMALCCVSIFAQQRHPQHGRGPGNGELPNFDKFLEDRISFVTKAMALSKEDSIKFVPIYKEKLKAKGELMFKSRPTTHIIPGQQYPDSVYTNAAMTEAKYKVEDAKIDMDYLKKFQKILSPKQIFSYVQAEKMFVGSFMHGSGPRPNRPK